MGADTGRAAGDPETDLSEAASEQLACSVPLACTLSREEQRERGVEIAMLLREGRPVSRKTPDGYVLQFPGELIWAERLFGFIMREHECCPFFRFALVIAPGQGPIELQIGGPEGSTNFVGELLAQTGLEGEPPA